MWGDLLYFPLILAVLLINFTMGLAIGTYREQPGKRKLAVYTAVGLNLLTLALFKVITT
jgi:hypothetical protein